MAYASGDRASLQQFAAVPLSAAIWKADAPVPGLDRADEIGDIARALAFARERGAAARRARHMRRRSTKRAAASRSS